MNDLRPVLALAAASLLTSTTLAHADQWTAPTAAELAMTSIPEVANAPALYLFKEQTTDDAMHMHSYYVRLKVLNERGKDYANVELPYVTGHGGYTVEEIAGRTIHPDGTVIPFTGKPYEKLVAKVGGFKEKEKVFTLPSVEVGSILEYRYKIRYDDMYYQSPDWYIQSDLFMRKGHYQWKPTDKDLVNEKGDLVSGQVAWAPILPTGTELKTIHLTSGKLQIDLDVHDIAPMPHEDYMPPMASISYRVLFYYTAYRTGGDFWKSEGKSWSKAREHFIGPNNAVKDFVAKTIAPGDSEAVKAQKLYAALMTFENTDFTRERSTREEKAEGLKDVANSGDVVTRRRGSSDQLAQTFVAMARAAGLKAYLAAVADRDQRFFVPMYLSLRQLDDDIAILSIDGKEVFYDPGQRFAEPGHLAWKHTVAGGVRQVEGGTAIFTTPSEPYRFSTVERIADLALDEHGEATGPVTLTFNGDPALRWRQEALRGDDTSLNGDLRAQLEHMLPGGMEVRVTDVQNLSDYTKPLKVIYEVKGPVGSSTGKRLLVPADLFEANSKPVFASAKRESVIDMHYSSMTRDAVRFKLPSGIEVESVPQPAKAMFQQTAAFDSFTRRTGNTVTSFRNVTLGAPLFSATDYAELKGFYGKLEGRDQETLIFTRGTAPAQTPAAAPVAAAKPTTGS